MKTSLLAIAGTLLILGTAHGQALKNGDFTDTRAHWEGAGKVLTLDDAQKPADAKAGGVPQLQVALNRLSIQETKQRLNFPPSYTGPVTITVVFKTSPDFARNDKSPKFTPGNTWKPGGMGCWSAQVYPKFDFYVRVDSDTHYYLSRPVQAGGDWQTLTGKFDSLGNSSSKVLALVTTAGEGTVWIKSVTVVSQ